MPSLDLLNAIPTLKNCYFRRLSVKAGKLSHIGETAASPANRMIASSLVRQIAQMGGDVTLFIPKEALATMTAALAAKT